MAVNHGAVAEFEVFSDLAGADPVEEGFFDGVTVGMIADGAFDLVIFEIGFVAARRIFPFWEFRVGSSPAAHGVGLLSGRCLQPQNKNDVC